MQQILDEQWKHLLKSLPADDEIHREAREATRILRGKPSRFELPERSGP